MARAKDRIPYPRQLQRNGLAFFAVGVVAAIALALLHGGIGWDNFGLLHMVAGVAMVVIGRVMEARARTADEGARER